MRTGAITVGAMRAGAMLALLVCSPLVAAGCKSNPAASPTTCVSDRECGSQMACMGGSCIARDVSQGTWAIELLPRSDSTAAPTQFAAKTFSSTPTVLIADAKMTVTGNLPPGSSLAGDSHVIATVETAIPGHADLQIETDWFTKPGEGMPPPFSLTVPASAIGQDATFRISPLPPRDEAQPPVAIPVRLAPVMNLTVMNNSVYISGYLGAPVSALQGGFAARAFEDGQLVSNVFPVDAATGWFRLNIPAEAIYATSGRPVTVEITPSKSYYSTPRFVTPTIVVHGDINLGTLALPAITVSNLYRFKVVGPDQQPVVGATVRVRTILGSDNSGVSDFLREGNTDMNGNIDLPLLPGSAEAARSYDVSVLPPPNSAFGVACVNNLSITAAGLTPGGVGDPPLITSLGLPPKVSLTGTIWSADGVPVSGVTISAARTLADTSTTCSSILAPPVGTSSKEDGTFKLLIDPGTYRFDYDPPAGAPVPRLTETDIKIVPGDNPARVVQMLLGELVTGAVHAAEGSPLPFVGVRFFDIACSGEDACYGKNRVEPVLRAETHTDSDGNFRAVVPMQQSAP